ncbi:hypothetical protein BLSTO_00203 [Blastocystis sp. subtype 1]
MVSWRAKNRIDYLLQDIYAKQLTIILSRKLRFIEHGTDRLNRPLTIINIGAFRLCSILEEHSMEDILLVFHYYTEHVEQKCHKISRELHRDYTGNVTIMDMKGLSLRKHFDPKAIDIFKSIVLINTYYYPESCQAVYVVNSPPIFSFFWNLISPLMNQSQYTKLKIIRDVSDLSSSLSNRHELLEFFPAASLPCRYGGSCHCSLEDILFKENTEEEMPLLGGVLHVVDSEVSKHEQKVEEGDLVDLSFSSLGNDVEYSVYLLSEQGRVGLENGSDA